MGIGSETVDSVVVDDPLVELSDVLCVGELDEDI